MGKLDQQELNGTLAAKWGRQLVPYIDTNDGFIHLLYADEALTGFAELLTKPKIGEFQNNKCVLVHLSTWMMLNQLASQTATPFRIVAVGKKIIVAAWRPLTGLKYAVRNTEYGAMLHIPITEFKELE